MTLQEFAKKVAALFLQELVRQHLIDQRKEISPSLKKGMRLLSLSLPPTSQKSRQPLVGTPISSKSLIGGVNPLLKGALEAKQCLSRQDLGLMIYKQFVAKGLFSNREVKSWIVPRVSPAQPKKIARGGLKRHIKPLILNLKKHELIEEFIEMKRFQKEERNFYITRIIGYLTSVS